MTKQATVAKTAATIETAGQMRDTFKGKQTADVQKIFRKAGTAYTTAGRTFFLTVLATYLHAGRDDTRSMIRDTWAESTDPARQYATNIVAMAHRCAENGEAAALPALRTVAELRALAGKFLKKASPSKKEPEGGDTGNQGETGEQGSVGNPVIEALVAKRVGDLGDALEALAAIATEAGAAAKNRGLKVGDLRQQLATLELAILAQVTRMRLHTTPEAEQAVASVPAVVEETETAEA